MQEDSSKDREQLIVEIQKLRARLAIFEKEAKKGDETPSRLQRNELQTEIQFIGDFGLLRARGVDLSEGGICFEVDEDIPFDMEFELDDATHQHRARLVWMKSLPNGRSRFGFEFTNAPPSDLLWLYRELDEDAE
jgi:hypothetical protein